MPPGALVPECAGARSPYRIRCVSRAWPVPACRALRVAGGKQAPAYPAALGRMDSGFAHAGALLPSPFP